MQLFIIFVKLFSNLFYLLDMDHKKAASFLRRPCVWFKRSLMPAVFYVVSPYGIFLIPLKFGDQ
jgi:hypothetical protein